MKVIIIGLGQTGILLAQRTAAERHDTVVVDCDREKVEAVTNLYSVSGVCGSGASRAVLLQAGADMADVIIAVSPVDEINLMACMVAKNCGTRYAVARIHRPELSGDSDYFAREFQIDYVVNPKLDTALEMHRQIGMQGKVKADAYFSDAATIIRARMDENIIQGGSMSLRDMKSFFGTDMLAVTVTRGEKLYVPDGNFMVQPGDVAGIIAADTVIPQIVTKLGLVHKPAKKVVLVGGGTVAYYLGKMLLDDRKKVAILEKDRTRCQELTQLLPEAEISLANGVDADVLLDEGLKKADVCVSLTGSDDANLAVSLFAWSCGVESVITRVNSTAYEKLLNSVNMDITISPAVISADRIMGFVRNVTVYNEKGNDIQCLYQLAGGMAEAVEFIAYDSCRKLGLAFKHPEFRLKKDILVAMIIRREQVLIPDGNSCIRSGDRVVVVSRKGHGLNTLDDIFQ
ncbi:MAG TPA: Trk system potassium transporter TrkA [Lachnospiraceae bacterium]|nr:Trk system potassium transporter TrkA [Lachnospiraceae bacterium]